ncbi:MAG TPA: hypothetical protein VMU08_02515 [Rhizomicrobium sp.]|nr:hypothetical protein [Rhizomicrobium sp.]
MVKAQAIAAACAITLAGIANSTALAHERGQPLVLNGQLNTADFDGGVGDRFGAGVYAGPYGYAISYGGASAGAFAAARAAAFAHASAFARASSGGMHGGGAHGGHR